MALADRAELAVRLTLDDRQFSGGLRRAQGSLGNFSKGASRVGKGVGQLGLGLGRVGVAAGAAAVGGLALVARHTISWESALAGVNKTMDLTDTELQTIGNQIRQLALEIPLGTNEIAGLVEQAGALGIAKNDVVEFARVAATMGVTTDVAADQAASSLGTMAGLLRLTGDDFERFNSTIVDLGNKGAATESTILNIAERAAGAGATIGLTAEQILGWSSAVANVMRDAPEAGGSALQKFFLDMATMVNDGGKDLKTIADVAGVTTKEITDAFKGNPSKALETFLVGFSELGKGERLDLLKDLGFNDVRIKRTLLGLAEFEKNTEEVQGSITDSLAISAEAWKNNVAAAEEADKRYGTVASKMALLKNQFGEAALVIGEGFLPALGRMSDKLRVLLNNPEQRKTLTELGRDIGKIIDGIDFNKVVAGAKVAVAVIKSIWDVLRLIPPEVSAIVAGFYGLNKISGGLLTAGIGNIAGGIVESVGRSLFTKLPGIGKFGALPVYVTNMGPGGMLGGAGGKGVFGRAAGGLGAALGGGAALGAAGIAASGAGLAAVLAAVQKLHIEPQLQREAGENVSDVQAVIARGDLGEITTTLAGLKNLPNTLDPLQRVLYELNANGVKTHTESLIGALTAAQARLNQQKPPALSPDERQFQNDLRAKQERQHAKLQGIQAGQAALKVATTAKLDTIRAAQIAQRIALAAKIEASKQTSVANKNAIVSAIVRSVPVVNTFVNVSGITQAVVKTGQTVNAGGKFGNKQVPV